MESTVFLAVILVPAVGFYAVFFVALCKDCVTTSLLPFFGKERDKVVGIPREPIEPVFDDFSHAA